MYRFVRNLRLLRLLSYICAKKILIDSNPHVYLQWHKTCDKHDVGNVTLIIYYFDLISLLATNHIISFNLLLQWHTRVYEETLDVNSKIAQTNAKYLKFHCQKVEYLRNGNLQRLSKRFQTLNWRLAGTVQIAGVSWIVWESWQHCSALMPSFSSIDKHVCKPCFDIRKFTYID